MNGFTIDNSLNSTYTLSAYFLDVSKKVEKCEEICNSTERKLQEETNKRKNLEDMVRVLQLEKEQLVDKVEKLQKSHEIKEKDLFDFIDNNLKILTQKLDEKVVQNTDKNDNLCKSLIQEIQNKFESTDKKMMIK